MHSSQYILLKAWTARYSDKGQLVSKCSFGMHFLCVITIGWLLLKVNNFTVSPQLKTINR